jgi:hypothetical protein
VFDKIDYLKPALILSTQPAPSFTQLSLST